MAYNATVHEVVVDESGGMLLAGTFVAEVDAEGRMTRSNRLGNAVPEGPEYHARLVRANPRSRFEVVPDDCRGYCALFGDTDELPQLKARIDEKYARRR